MKLIYLILVHKDLEQVNKLIDSIFCDDVSIYVHIDKKSKINPIDINPKAQIIKNRVSVIGGDYSQVQATLNSIEEIDKNEPHYEHICYISGQDYPIKSNRDILNMIKKDKNYIEYCEIYKQSNGPVHHRFEGGYYTKRFHVLRRMSGYLTRFHQKYLNIKRKPIPNITIFGGSNGWILSQTCIKFILEFVQNPANKKFINYFKGMCCCDEHFFHCILLNSAHKSNIINDNLRYIMGIHAGSPETLTIEDCNNIITSNKLFCRKIDSVQSKELIQMLDKYRDNDT